MKIFKYQFQIDDRVNLALPEGAKILHVEVQDGSPCLWALVRPTNALVQRRFHIFGTGHSIDDAVVQSLTHVATFQQSPFVWHLFEIQ